jgi:hypothetical protein
MLFQLNIYGEGIEDGIKGGGEGKEDLRVCRPV